MADTSERSRFSRRGLLAGLAALPTAFAAGVSRAAQPGQDDRQIQDVRTALSGGRGTKLVILGSGAGPIPLVPGRSRYMTSHVMLSDGRAYVLDCGLGVTNQFARTGISFT